MPFPCQLERRSASATRNDESLEDEDFHKLSNKPRNQFGNNALKSKIKPRQENMLKNFDLSKPVAIGVSPSKTWQSLTPPISNAYNLSPSTTPATSTPLNTSSRQRSQFPKYKSQSQPGSRSTSPSGKFSHITYTQPDQFLDKKTTKKPIQEPLSFHIPQHLRTSRRDKSPCMNLECNDCGSHNPTVHTMALFSGGLSSCGANDMPDLMRVAEFLPQDDASSVTSSVSSDGAFKTMETSEIIRCLSSSQWSERRDGLVVLKSLMKANGILTPSELKKITVTFTRMFHDPNAKVFTAFLETLIEFVTVYGAKDLDEWLYICLSRLLCKMAADLLGSVLARVQKALEAVRDAFPCNLQLSSVARFVSDPAQQQALSNPKVRLAVLDHIHEMSYSMEPYEFSNTESVQQMIYYFVAWLSDAKSGDIRKAAQDVIVSLFNLNTPEFSNVLSSLPRPVQDCATKILHKNVFAVTSQEDYEPSTSDGLESSEGASFDEKLDETDYFVSLKKASENIQKLNNFEPID